MKKLNNKGFTLVELIVVIAVMGVLAAILVPMLVGYVAQSSIASSNATAGRIRDSITYFMTNAEIKGYGMFTSENSICDIDIDIDNGTWHLLASDYNVFSKKSDVRWQGEGEAGVASDHMDSSLVAENRLAYHLARAYPDLRYGYIKFRLAGGRCVALYFTKDQNSEIEDFPAFGDINGWSVPGYDWLNDEQGLYNKGIIVGTSPILPVDE